MKAHSKNDAGTPIRFYWYGDDEAATLINSADGVVVGYFGHDGYGKWDITAFVPLWQLILPSIRREIVTVWDWNFLRMRVDLFRAKHPEEARQRIEGLILKPDS